MTDPPTEADLIREQIARLRARLYELESFHSTREQVRMAIAGQEGGGTLKEYARAHRINLGALYRAVSERRDWLYRVARFGPGSHQAGPEP